MALPATVSCRLDALQWPAAIADSRLHIRAANSRFAERWTAIGGDPDLLAGGSIALLCPLEEQLRIRHDLWRLSTGIAQPHTLALTTPPVVLELTPIESNNEPGGWLATLHDEGRDPATDPSRLLIAALVHDLKMPVQAVLGWVSLLRKKPLERARLDDVLRVLERNALLEADMLNELLELTQAPNVTPSRHRSWVDVAELIRSTAEAMRPLAHDAGIDVRVDLDATPLHVLGDTRDLSRIVANLIANAIKFSDGGGTVECCLAGNDESIEIVVRDQGRGISAGFLPYVFDSFRREQEDRKAEGLGIGLAVVRQLAQRHGGTVRAESGGPGHGATFTVTLPREGDAPAGSAVLPGMVAPDCARTADAAADV